MEYTPLYDQVLVRPLAQSPEETRGSITLIKNTKQEDYWRLGTVVAVGSGDVLPDGTRAQMFSKPGDTVVYVTRRGAEVDWEGTKCMAVFEEQSVMCILRDERIEALHDRVVVIRDKPETMSKGGLFIPGRAQDKPGTGTVVAFGPGERNKKGKFLPISLNSGDRIHFGNFSGSEIEIDGTQYLVMRESDVFGVEEAA